MRVVIVEDEAPIREGLAKILDKINPEYEVVGKAADGEEGYALIVETKPDLVILDIQMPKMDGLTMLKNLREEENQCRVLILSAYSDFDYAKRAIELDIQNYLLKPIKIPELKNALQQIQDTMEKEERRERVFSVHSIFLGCLNGQLVPDEKFDMMTKETYGFTVEDPGQIFLVWLGDGYEKQKSKAIELLESVGAHTVKYASCIVESEAWKTLVMVLYRLPPEHSQYEYFRNSVTPMMCSNLETPVICVWRSVDRLRDLSLAVREMVKQQEWSLLFEKGTLISKESIDSIPRIPFKYPIELEDQICAAMKHGEQKTVINCYKSLFEYCRQDPHEPKDIKEAIIRFSLAVGGVYYDTKGVDLKLQNILSEIAEAVSWTQIKKSLEQFFGIIEFTLEEQEIPASVLIQNAMKIIKKYYDQGITLEEVANKLFVTDEYLSAQFKKETGSTFSETIRKYRVDKVKELLENTHLKLNQIAELAGYSDPKYMSKVFKEEVGMLPNEFRKSVH